MCNFFIFTSAGKPIYSWYGDEFDLSPVFATFSALIPKLISFYCNESFYPKQNFIQSIFGKGFKCNVLIKGHLIYVGITKYKESSTFLWMMLEYLHLQIVSLVTNQMNKMLTERPNLDVRSNIANLERPLHMMSDMVRRSPSFLLNAYPVITLNPLFWTDLAQLINEFKPKDFYYGLVITSTNVLALISSNDDPNPEIKPSDVNLIFNYIHSTPSLMSEETWTTMCIPGISEEYLLHVYCKFYN